MIDIPQDRDYWYPEPYEANVEHHRRHAPPFASAGFYPPAARVLDVGCGVGDLAERLSVERPDLSIVGVDASRRMIERARSRERPNLSFQVGRAEHLDFREEFDVVISSACLHWVDATEHEAVLKGVYRALRTGGRFAAEFAGKGNIERVLDIIRNVAAEPGYQAPLAEVGMPWFFPDAAEYEALLAGSPFAVHRTWLEPQERSFTVAEFVGWVRSQTLLPWLAVLDEADGVRFSAEVERQCLAATAAETGGNIEQFVRLHVEALRR